MNFNQISKNLKFSLIRQVMHLPRMLVRYFIQIAIDLLTKHPHWKSKIIPLFNRTPMLKNRIKAFIPTSGHIEAPIYLSARAQQIYKDLKQAMIMRRS
jgi:hypothetical protein